MKHCKTEQSRKKRDSLQQGHIVGKNYFGNDTIPVVSANTESLEFADVTANLYAHHTDPPDVTIDGKIAVEDTIMDGNLKQHIFVAGK